MHEAELHTRTCFLTLTYKNSAIPAYGSLKLEHWQLFAKRLRKKGKFSYLHCGEYGDLNGRPHYHAAIFGHDFTHNRTFLQTGSQGDSLYTSPTLDELWPHGYHSIGELSYESATYIASYIYKKVTGKQAERHYGLLVDKKTGEVTFRRRPEYITMSRNPAIGKRWIKKYMSDVYPTDEVINKGIPTPPPKYYDQQYEKVNPEGLKKIKALRIKRGETNSWDNTPERLAIREELAETKNKYKTREL